MSPGFGYTETDDLPVDAGDDGRCPPSTTKPREIAVRIEHVREDKPALYLVIAGLSIRKRLWPALPGSMNPNSCTSTSQPDALVFGCSEVMTGSTGRIYARGSDVVLGQSTTDGTKQTRYHLPCGSVARFERTACPTYCFASSADQCDCSQLSDTWPSAPRPASTTSAR